MAQCAQPRLQQPGPVQWSRTRHWAELGLQTLGCRCRELESRVVYGKMVLVTLMSTLVTLASLATVRAEVLELEEACGVLLQVDIARIAIVFLGVEICPKKLNTKR